MQEMVYGDSPVRLSWMTLILSTLVHWKLKSQELTYFISPCLYAGIYSPGAVKNKLLENIMGAKGGGLVKDFLSINFYICVNLFQCSDNGC